MRSTRLNTNNKNITQQAYMQHVRMGIFTYRNTMEFSYSTPHNAFRRRRAVGNIDLHLHRRSVLIRSIRITIAIKNFGVTIKVTRHLRNGTRHAPKTNATLTEASTHLSDVVTPSDVDTQDNLSD